MKAIIKSVPILCALFSPVIFACEKPASVCFQDNEGLPLISDGQPLPIFLLTSNAVGKTLSMKYAFPTETGFNQDLFSNTITKFDNSTTTFDKTTP